MQAEPSAPYQWISILKQAWVAASNERKESERRIKDLQKHVKIFRAVEEEAKRWTTSQYQPFGGNLLGILNQFANQLSMELGSETQYAGGMKLLEAGFYRLMKQAEAQVATGPPSSKQLVGELGKRGAKGVGHLAGSGLSAIGRRLSALETEPRRLPIVDGRAVQRGLSMPGERVRKVPPGNYYLDARLSELRNVTNPNIHVRLNEFEVEYFRSRAH